MGEAFPLPSKDASNVTKCLMAMFYRHGATKYVLTDNGKQFVNEGSKLFVSIFI